MYDNKGRVVEKYEPFFGRDFAFVPSEAAGRGQRVRLMYDPRGQLVRTRNPDGTEQRVLYGTPSGPVAAPVLDRLDLFAPSPWETYTYDANDLAPLTHAGQPAAAAVAGHGFTPQSAEVDPLGRVVRTTDRLHPTDALQHVVMLYQYDLRGNRLAVIDAYQRTSFAHVYDLKPKAGKDDPGANVLRTAHLDGGVRRALFDGAGQPLHGSDAKGALTLHAYDALGRPTDAWARDNAFGAVRRRQHLDYGTDAPNTPGAPGAPTPMQARNALGQLVAHYDEAGRVQLLSYDFKGNLLAKERQVVADAVFTGQWAAQAALNWAALPGGFNPHWDTLANPASRLAARVYQTSTEYDALNRPTRLILPQEAGAGGVRPVLLPTYNRAGGLAQVALDGQVLVAHVAYNARGQRLLLARGNGLMTRYAYDDISFRLLRLRTEGYTVSGEALAPTSGTVRQDTAYAYDLAGNITATTERAPQSGVAGAAALERIFEYDALYRLLSASGRENQPTAATPWQDEARSEAVAGTTGYTQRYRYDLPGNIEELRHSGAAGFTRTFDYGPRPRVTNYLQRVQVGGVQLADYAYDANGNVLRETLGRHLGWDASDQLRQFATWTGPGAAPTLLAYYVYDAGGVRTKKLTQTGASTWQVTVYVDGVFEHRYEVSGGTLGPDQTTLIILDGQSRLYQRRAGAALGDLRPAALYTLEDHLGSATATVNATGGVVSREEYYPFGETSFGSHAKQRYRFCGKERDQESGLYYYGMRYYAPWLCRFVSVDPLASDYPFYSSYQYAGNKPINKVDIDGLEEEGGTSQATAKSAPTTTGQDREAPQQNPSKQIVHQVKSGDTVSRIAQKYSTSVQEITKANALQDPNQIEIGQQLQIPQQTPKSSSSVVIKKDNTVVAPASNVPKQFESTNSSDATSLHRLAIAREYIGTGKTYKQVRGKGFETDNYMDCSEFILAVLSRTDPGLANALGGKAGNTTTIRDGMEKVGGGFHSLPKVGDIAVWDGHVEFVYSTTVKQGNKIVPGGILIIGARGQKGDAVTTISGYGGWLKSDTKSMQQIRSSKFHGFWTPPILRK